MNREHFDPGSPLVRGMAHADCVAVVAIPARDEAEALPACLEALRCQCDERGRPVPHKRFEILLLLNNCRDGSATVARRWSAAHPGVPLQVVERELPRAQANVGTARRLLMDTAWCRLSAATHRGAVILSTDADTVVHPQWLVRNLRALQAGADAVGGCVRLQEHELQRMSPPVRLAYERDRHYQRLIAELESLVDPPPGDPWPRHLDHFCASLAFTREVYAKAGGLPRVASLEDVAFIDALRRIDAHIRHDPSVQVFTSSRLSGRAELGFANQLRLWEGMKHGDREHRVFSAAFLHHRFAVLANLRSMFNGQPAAHKTLPARVALRLSKQALQHERFGEFLAAIDCDTLIRASFEGPHETDILTATRDLETLVGAHVQQRTVANPAA